MLSLARSLGFNASYKFLVNNDDWVNDQGREKDLTFPESKWHLGSKPTRSKLG